MATSAGEQLIDLVRQGWSKKSTLEKWSMIVGMLCYAFSRFYEFRRASATSEDGNTYDRSSIEAWLKTGKKTSPMTGAPLSHLGLAPNNLVRSMVSKYLETAKA